MEAVQKINAESMQFLQPIIDGINKRLTHFNPEKIVSINADSGILLHEKLLKNWNTERITNTNEVLTISEQGKIIAYSNLAYSECKQFVDKISNISVSAMQPIFESDERRALTYKIGLCYDWSHILSLAKQGKDSEVQKICSRDMFLIKTIYYWGKTNNVYCQKSGQSLVSDYVQDIKDIYEGIFEASNWKELKFPEMSKQIRDYDNLSAKEVKDSFDTGLKAIKTVVQKANSKEFI